MLLDDCFGVRVGPLDRPVAGKAGYRPGWPTGRVPDRPRCVTTWSTPDDSHSGTPQRVDVVVRRPYDDVPLLVLRLQDVQ